MNVTEKQLQEFQETLEKSIESVEKGLPEVIDASLQKKFDSQIEEKINAAIKAAGLDKANFPGLTNAEGVKVVKDNSVKFFQALWQNDTAAIKTMTEGIDSSGGFLVPEEVLAEVDRIADENGLMRKLSRVIPMGRDILNMPTLGTKPTVYWPGEANAGTSSEAVLKNIKLEAKTAVGLTPVSNELMEDANMDVVNMLVELFAEQLAGEEDNQGLNGVGAPFTGILNNSDTNAVTAAAATTVAALTVADLVDGNNLPSAVLSGSVWVFHRNVWAGIKKNQEDSQSLIAFNSTNIMSMKTEAGALIPAGFLLGYPVYLSDKMPSAPATGEAYGIFGNFKKFYFGNRKKVSVSMSDSATIGGDNMFTNNSKAIRVTERVALTVGVPEAFNVLYLA